MKRILILLLILISGFALGCPNPLKKIKLKNLWGQTFDIKNKGTTPNGANVWKQDGTTVDGNDLQAIDDGLSRLFAKSACQISPHDNLPYSRILKHSDYIIAILKSTDLDSQGQPAIRIPPGQYKGTEYDKGGYILIAGQVLAVGNPYGNIMVIPDHNANFDRMANAVEYEGEHLVLAWNDPDKFKATETHGAGTGHPIIADCNSSVISRTQIHAVGRYQTEYGTSLIFLTK